MSSNTVSKEQIRKARMADLYRFLKKHHMDDLLIEGHSIRLKGNHSVSIKQSYSGYNDFSNDETGNAIDCLTKYFGYQFTEAVWALNEESDIVHNYSDSIKDTDNNQKNTINNAVFPPRFNGIPKKLFDYLLGRAIPEDIINMLITQNLMYLEKTHNNIVFINGKKTYAEIRGTCPDKPFHSVVRSQKEDFWFFYVGSKPKCAYICEAAIDAISLYVLHQKAGIKNEAFYCSIGGVTNQAAINCIKRKITAVLAVDNDHAGNQCAIKNQDLRRIIPLNKDWNEDLIKEEQRYVYTKFKAKSKCDCTEMEKR